jgi:hypothetical protein
MRYNPCRGTTLVEKILCKHRVRGFNARIYIGEAWRLLELLLENQDIDLDKAVDYYIINTVGKYGLEKDTALEIAYTILEYISRGKIYEQD